MITYGKIQKWLYHNSQNSTKIFLAYTQSKIKFTEIISTINILDNVVFPKLILAEIINYKVDAHKNFMNYGNTEQKALRWYPKQETKQICSLGSG